MKYRSNDIVGDLTRSRGIRVEKLSVVNQTYADALQIIKTYYGTVAQDPNFIIRVRSDDPVVLPSLNYFKDLLCFSTSGKIKFRKCMINGFLTEDEVKNNAIAKLRMEGIIN